MSFRLSSLRDCLTLAFFAGACLFSTSAYAQGETRPRRAIELSETNNTEVLNRLNQLTDKKEGLKELQGEWSKAFESLSFENRANEGALPPQYTPPRPTPIPSKRMKEFLERKRTWMLTPDDLLPENSSDDWLNDAGNGSGRKDRNKSSLKQFSEALDRRKTDNSKPDSMKGDEEGDLLKTPSLMPDNSLQDDPSLPAGIRNSAKNLRSWLGNETEQSALNPVETRSTFEDFFGFGNNRPNQEQEKAQKAYLDRYQTEVLGISGLSPSLSTPNPLMNALAPANSPLQAAYSGGLESAASGLKPDNLGQTAGTLNSVLTPLAVPDLNSKALNQWNPLYTTPRPDPPKTAPVTFPSMDFPRRRF